MGPCYVPLAERHRSIRTTDMTKGELIWKYDTRAKGINTARSGSGQSSLFNQGRRPENTLFQPRMPVIQNTPTLRDITETFAWRFFLHSHKWGLSKGLALSSLYIMDEIEYNLNVLIIDFVLNVYRLWIIRYLYKNMFNIISDWDTDITKNFELFSHSYGILVGTV